MGQQVRTDASSNNNWWVDLWSGLASAIGWVSNAIGANQCTGPNEYYDASKGKCVAIPNCGSGTHLDEQTMTCVPDIGLGSTTTTWLIIAVAGVVLLIVVMLFLKKR